MENADEVEGSIKFMPDEALKQREAFERKLSEMHNEALQEDVKSLKRLLQSITSDIFCNVLFDEPQEQATTLQQQRTRADALIRKLVRRILYLKNGEEFPPYVKDDVTRLVAAVCYVLSEKQEGLNNEL